MIRTVLSRLLRVGACLLAILVLLSGCPSTRPVITPTTTPPTLPKVSALGHIEPQGGIILISAAPGEQVTDVLVGEAANVWSVKMGEKLVALKSEAMRIKEKVLAQVQLEAAEKQLAALKESGTAQVREAELKKDDLLAGAGSDIASLQLKVGLLKAQYEAAREDTARLTGLSAGTISAQDQSKQRLAERAALVDMQSAELSLNKSKQSLERNREEADARILALKKSLERAEAEVSIEAARINRQLADLRFNASEVRSPMTGVVLDVAIHKGDTTSTRPLMRLASLDSLVVIAEVDESDVLKVHLKDRARVTSSVLDGTLGIKQIEGKVTAIGQTIAPNRLSDINPAARSDRRVVEVKIELVGLDELKPEQRKGVKRMIGLQVNVDIDVPRQPEHNNEN